MPDGPGPLLAELARIQAYNEGYIAVLCLTAATVATMPSGDLRKCHDALRKVLERHVPDDKGFCTGCAIDLSDDGEEPFSSGAWRSWPCPTYQDIAAELLGESAVTTDQRGEGTGDE